MSDDRECQGYRVIDSVRVADAEIVLAHNSKEAEPYVTWKCYKQSGYREFDTGRYFKNEQAARVNMLQRALTLQESLSPPQRAKPSRDRGR